MMRCAITNGTFDPAAGPHQLTTRCPALAAEGVDLIVVREKHLPAAALVALVKAIVAAAPATKVLVAAGRADVALAAGAAGVHLSAAPGELKVHQIRQLLPKAFVTASCHTLADIHAAATADAVLYGPIFGKTIAGHEVTPALGLPSLQQACTLGVPVLALGGVTPTNTPACIQAGAAGIAAIRMFFP